MKIALLGPLDHFGGGPKVILELYKRFKNTHQVDIITDFYNEENTYSEFRQFSIKILGYRFKNVPFLRRFTVIKSWLNLNMSYYDFAISTHPYSHMTAFKNKNVLTYVFDVRTLFHSFKWSRYKGVLSIIDYFFNLPFKYIEKKSIQKNQCVITLSNYSKNEIKKYYKIDSYVIGAGISFSDFQSKLSEDFCLYAGRISYEKRIELIIKAWNYVDKNLKLYIIGRGSNAYVNYLKTISQNKNIHFAGPLNEQELKDMYNRCLCVIYTGIGEGFGLVALESLASGKPVIISKDGGGLVELVNDNVDGFVIEPEPEIIAEKVNFLNRNRNIAEEMGRKGKEKSKEYDWNIIAEKILNFVKEKIANRMSFPRKWGSNVAIDSC